MGNLFSRGINNILEIGSKENSIIIVVVNATSLSPSFSRPKYNKQTPTDSTNNKLTSGEASRQKTLEMIQSTVSI
jgi:hypothetical protein